MLIKKLIFKMIEYFPDNYTREYYFRYLFFKNIPEFLYKFILKYGYKKFTGKVLHLDSPERLSEKIQYIKLYGNNKEKGFWSDKILAKDYIQSKIPELKCTKVYQYADCFKKLDFSQLPKSFILKTNHAWKTNIIIRNKNFLIKNDITKLEKFYNKVLGINYAYWSYYELQYKEINPLIFAEELIGDCEDIANYEVWCINGRVEFITCRILAKDCTSQKYFNKQFFFDREWKNLDFYIAYKTDEKAFLFKRKDKITEYAEILSKNFDFVRVDFMEIDNELYFGEMTFTPYSGFFQFEPDYYDIVFGKKLVLKDY